MWSDILTKQLQSAKFHEMQAHLMNCPIDYYENSAPECIMGNIQALIKNQPSYLPLQGCLETCTSTKHKPVEGQMAKKLMAACEQCMHWKMLVDDIVDHRLMAAN